MKTTRTIISYDITKDQTRTKTAENLKYYGLKRIQYSVFEGELTNQDLKNLKKDLRKTKTKENDSIHIIYQCKRCKEKREIIGKKPDKTPHHEIL
ncbi:CRISPR-associated endonuclease Cas2 [Methanonatronarchaeum sp. AMET-Sl]|uniref:CRISPR-associated endonuclease Cas2 n=1 Tax=Methanonatronarchaeum sp. AMET-Sl TaxID=3037654 RepID=UPI00244E3867|nr:CRISPR-associated endonuclease Cas2 [Methanonatronarchaeum sp. AMET-Sl]WGI17155.1 CRISPR-associated endonuclease Cas2 [Methanonatronarchaeum sp. AMET-Sl]